MKKVLLWSAALVLALDQVTKVVIVFWMDLISKGQIDIWPGFIHFHMAWNTGINFGLFSDQGDLMRWLLIAVALVVCGFVGYWMRHEQKPIALICGGFGDWWGFRQFTRSSLTWKRGGFLECNVLWFL